MAGNLAARLRRLLGRGLDVAERTAHSCGDTLGVEAELLEQLGLPALLDEAIGDGHDGDRDAKWPQGFGHRRAEAAGDHVVFERQNGWMPARPALQPGIERLDVSGVADRERYGLWLGEGGGFQGHRE